MEAREGIDKNIENLNAKKHDLESTLENKKEEMKNKLNAHDVQLKKMKEVNCTYMVHKEKNRRFWIYVYKHRISV